MPEGGLGAWDDGYYPSQGEEWDDDYELEADEARLDDDLALDLSRLRELWATLPEPPWDDERAQRIFEGIQERLGMQRRRRFWLTTGAAIALPFALLVTSRLAR